MRRAATAGRIAAIAALVAAGAILSACNGGDSETSKDPNSHRLLNPDSNAGRRLAVAAAGDFGMKAPGKATLAAMAKSKPDMYLGLGDLSYAGPRSERPFCRLVRSRVGPDAPFEIVSGNHEEDTGGDGLIAEFADCLPDRLNAVGEYGKQYYFDVGRLARFIMISPDLTIEGVHYFYGRDDDGSDNANLSWLDTAIDEAREFGIEWVVVGTHKPCISVGEYYCDIYQDLFSRLIEKNVDLVLSGHDHTYQRSKQITAPRGGCKAIIIDRFDRDCVVDDDDSAEKGAGSVFVISGAGGGELYPLQPNDPEAGYFAATMGKNSDPRHGFAMLTISPRALRVRFVGSSPGSFADRFEIVNE
jgi:3',5'-cyclic AMP phosphodiesterase CpdA